MTAFDWARFERVFFDSAPIIYQVESHPDYSLILEPLFSLIDDGTVTGVVSGVTLAECLHYPIRMGDRQLERDYLTLMTDSPGIEFVDIDGWISDLAVRLRVKHSLDLMDAFQLATAITARADAFITNDLIFQRVTEIPVIMLSKINSAPPPADAPNDSPSDLTNDDEAE
jgi:predicted nucleic acid-binding protein